VEWLATPGFLGRTHLHWILTALYLVLFFLPGIARLPKHWSKWGIFLPGSYWFLGSLVVNYYMFVAPHEPPFVLRELAPFLLVPCDTCPDTWEGMRQSGTFVIRFGIALTAGLGLILISLTLLDWPSRDYYTYKNE